MEPLFGAFVDYLVLRNRVDSSQTFLQLMENVQRSTNEAYAHQIPFCKVAEALREQRDLASNPLFRAMLILRDIPLTKMEAAGLDIELSVLPVDRAVSEVDVSLYIQDHDGTLDGYFEYDPRLFDSESIRQLSDRLSRVLHHIVSNRHSGISCLEREVDTAAA
jgi:non-ribosomal peptide synthetase component F